MFSISPLGFQETKTKYPGIISEDLVFKMESYFTDLDKVQGALEVLKTGFVNPTMQGLIETNLNSLQNNYGSIYRAEYFNNPTQQLLYRAENIFSKIWEKIVAFWKWLVGKIKSIFGKDAESSVSATKENASEISKISKQIPKNNIEINKDVEDLVNYKKASQRVIDQLDEEMKKEDELYNLEREAKELILRKKKESANLAPFNLHKIYSGSSFRYGSKEMFEEVNSGIENIRNYVNENKVQFVKLGKTKENFTLNKWKDDFWKTHDFIKSSYLYTHFSLSTKNSNICFIGKNKFFVITEEENGKIRASFKSKEKPDAGPLIFFETIEMQFLDFIASDLSNSSIYALEVVNYIEKVIDETNKIVQGLTSEQAQIVASSVSELTSRASVYPAIIANFKDYIQDCEKSSEKILTFYENVKKNFT